MSNIYSKFVLFSLLCFSTQISYSQCNPALTIEPAFNCFTAASSAINGSGTGFVCDLNNFCISTGAVPQLDPPIPFCSTNSVLNNPIWFSFIADASGVLDVEVITAGCTGGIQWALYDQCGNYFNTIACQSFPVLPANSPFNIFVNGTIPGATYYLVIDGANGATCNYELHVNDGISPIFVGDAIGTTLTGNTMICGGSTVNYSFPGIQFGTDYHWTLPDGSTIDSEGPNTSISFPEGMTPGPYQLCVTASNDCDPNDDAVPVCWDITILEEPKYNVFGEVCQGDTYNFRGGNYPPGSYTFNYQGPNGTSCDTTYNLVIVPLPNTNGPDQQVYKCEDDIFAFVDGVPFQSGPAANIVTYVNSRGCDSLVNFYINDVQLSGTVQANPASLPCGGTATSTLSLAPGFVFPPDAYGIKWYNALDVEIGMGSSVVISNPGYYYAIVTTFMNNTSNPLVEPQQIICTEYFPVTITAENSTLVMPVTTGPTTLCAGENYTFDVTNIQTGVLSYTWNHVDGTVMGVGNGSTINLSYATAGNYQICVNAVDGCGPGPETCFPIQVVPSPTVSLAASYAVCAKEDSLTATLGGIPNLTDPLLQYIWIATAGPDIAGVVFTPANDPNTVVTVVQPGTYTFQFGADYNGQGCGESKTIDVKFEEALVLTPKNIQACNDLLQPLPSMVDLDTLVSGNIAYTGTWKLVSGPGTPGGTLPIQDFTGMTNTGVYVYEYTPNQAGVCVVTPVQVQIDLQNCICPPLSISPNAGTTCNDVGTINLNNTIQGATGAGTWTVTNKPVGSTVVIAGGIANFSSQPAGTYDFTYTLTNSMAGCPMTAVTTVTIMSAPVATLKTVEQACNSNFSPDYVNEVDFDTLVVSGVTGGVWTYTGPGGDPGSASFSPKDFNGATPGTYEYTYTIMGDPSCQAVSYTIDIIVEDCKCPSVAISPEESFCNTIPTINLNDYKVTTKPGSWFIESGPVGSTATITGGNMFVGTGSPYGQYVLYYKLDAAVPIGCFDTAQLILTLDSTAFAGANDVYDRCADFGSSVDLDTVLSQQQLGGTWLYTGGPNIGSAFNATTGVLDFNSLAEGTGYTFNYTVASALGLCPATTSTLTLAKNALPVADAGTDGYIDCVIETVSIGGPNTSTGAGINYSWTNTTNSTAAGNTATVSGIVDAGIYELEVTNTLTGCVETDVVEVKKDNAAIVGIGYEVDSISCYNKADGQVRILGINGGTPSFEYSIDGGSYGPTVNFTDLGPGNHTIEVLDDNGCHYAQTILIENPKEVKVELGTNKVIAEGDIVTISPDISINIKDANIVWSSNPEGTSCNDCPQLTVEPTITTVYNVVVTNENGCVAEDSIEIRVKSVIRVFIPTAISPNNDGINDVFYIQTDRNVTRINKLVIFNRWGDVQFSIEDTPPDDPAYGWNGRFGEQKTNTPAVFVYLAVVTLRDGRQLTYKGDITVVR
ncbi:MAG: gliding motility-associated C-terminal domain-containing protein [Saprospiraceae bacterium]|nr:gliding motility-associated C-terminal domain-containing protein [Candidatus Brachybacter algidus]